MLTYCMHYVHIASKYIACIIHTMTGNGYLQLVDQRNELSKPLFQGVHAAKKHLHLINFKIAQIEKDPNVFEPSYVFKKPGFTKPMINVLTAQARRGSIVSEIELQKYADWIIDQMAVGK